MSPLITIENTFHHTHTRVRPAKDGTLSARQVARVVRDLCGMADCRCWHIQTTDDRLEIVETDSPDRPWRIVDDAGEVRP